jgi:hypothetical protein
MPFWQFEHEDLATLVYVPVFFSELFGSEELFDDLSVFLGKFT